jgi:hypothetical protein
MHFFKSLVILNLLFVACFSPATTTALAVKKKIKVPNTCAELQGQFNRSSWEYKTTFEGFESLPMNTRATISNAGNDRLCQLGYITEITPMGKMVCQGYIYLSIKSIENIYWNYGYYRQTIHSPANNKTDFCRYVN